MGGGGGRDKERALNVSDSFQLLLATTGFRVSPIWPTTGNSRFHLLRSFWEAGIPSTRGGLVPGESVGVSPCLLRASELMGQRVRSLIF